jgi:hypothetical protein
MIWVIKLRRMSWAGCLACMGEKRNAYRIFVGKPEEEEPIGRPRLRRNCNMKMDLKKYS